MKKLFYLFAIIISVIFIACEPIEPGPKIFKIKDTDVISITPNKSLMKIKEFNMLKNEFIK